MLEKMTLSMVNHMVNEKIIDDEQREYYFYALIIIAERAISVGSILILSIIMHRLISTVLFLICFLSLRERTGGFHLNTFAQCYPGTVCIYLFVSAMSTFMTDHLHTLLGILFLAICAIEVIGTANHPNMHLNRTELVNLKKAARILAVLQGSAIFALAWFDADRTYVCYMSMAVIVCAVMLLLAKIIKQEVKENEENE